MENNKKLQVVSFLLVALLFNLWTTPVTAGSENRAFSLSLDRTTIARGYTVAAFDNAIKFALIPGILGEATAVEVLELNEPVSEPWQLKRVSPVYQFEFKNKAAYDNHKPFVVQLQYAGNDASLKQVYYFDKNYNSWRPLPTKDYPGEHWVRAYIHLPFARLAVFSNPTVLSSGTASWYKYKGGLYAASPDFPKGSRLRVYNQATGAFVDVVVNDFGPDRKLHPERVVDLDKIAFQKLADTSEGIIKITVEPLFVPEKNGSVLGVRLDATEERPSLVSKAAIVMDAQSGEVLYEYNATSSLPLASLTKIMTANILLETNPDFAQTVTYSQKDEEFTWQNVTVADRARVARLRLEDGDQLTLRDAFLSTLMASTNNTAETLVRASGLERTDFINRMNERAAEWGAVDTHFLEPTGLSPDNVSTVHDYAIITKHALGQPLITEATTLREYRFETQRDKQQKLLRSTNQLLNSSYAVVAGKTGYLDEAGYCLMTAVSVDGRVLIGVVFGSPDRETNTAEMEEILRYGRLSL